MASSADISVGSSTRPKPETVHAKFAAETEAWIRVLIGPISASPRTDWGPEKRRTAPFFVQ
jgi:hypothetical protein